MAEEPPVLLGDPNTPLPASIVSTISITDDTLLDLVGAFLQSILGNLPVIRGQDNRVPQPAVSNYIAITPTRRVQLSTTRHYDEPDDNVTLVDRAIRADFQFDVYGPSSTDNAQTLTTLLRDDYGFTAFDGTGVSPLYCDDGRQMPLIDGEAQYEGRWMVQASFQINPAVSTPTQFADSVAATITKAD
jgi:hypothetical protein